MNTNIRTVSVHDTLFGRVANNLEVGQLSRAVEPWFADFHDSRVKQAIADLDEPRAERRGLSSNRGRQATLVGPFSSAVLRYQLRCARRICAEMPVPLGARTPLAVPRVGFEPTTSRV